MDEDDINMDGGGFTDIRDLTERSTGPTEPGRIPESFDPVELPSDEDILTEENDFEITNRDDIRSFLDEFFESFFEEQLDEEYFDQESDRFDAAQDARRFMGLVDDYEAGEISWEELISEENLPRDMLSYDDTFTDYYNALMSSFEAEEVISALETNPERLNDPVFDRLSFPQTEQIITDSAFSFAGVGPPSASTTTVTSREVVVTEGQSGGISGNIFDILETGGKIFGENVPVVQYDPETGEPLRDVNGDVVTENEYRPGILDVMIPHLPGISLPSWMPSAGVIFLPTIQSAINKVADIIENTDIGAAWEEGDIGEVLNDIGEIIVRSGESAVDVIESKVEELIDTITGAILDPTKAGAVLGGIIGTAFPSIPQWLPPLILDPRVRSAVSNVLTQEFDADPNLFTEEQDPTLMFTNRGNNVFVSKEGDEFFVLSESEDFDFELNGQYTREQLENTGLETVDSGRYQELLNNLSFYALEEDIYQYSIKELVRRFEEEGGIIPGDFDLMDDESQYDFFIDEFFNPTPIGKLRFQLMIPTQSPTQILILIQIQILTLTLMKMMTKIQQQVMTLTKL